MKKYGVTIPVAGYVYKEIEAESENDALEMAFDEGFEDDEVNELEMYEKLMEGNICYIYNTRAYAEEIEE